MKLSHAPCPRSCSNIVLPSDDSTELALPPLARDLQLWPELVEIGSEVHSSRRKSLYAALFQGQHVMLKVRGVYAVHVCEIGTAG